MTREAHAVPAASGERQDLGILLNAALVLGPVGGGLLDVASKIIPSSSLC